MIAKQMYSEKSNAAVYKKKGQLGFIWYSEASIAFKGQKVLSLHQLSSPGLSISRLGCPMVGLLPGSRQRALTNKVTFGTRDRSTCETMID
jgi:hypothetical protein